MEGGIIWMELKFFLITLLSNSSTIYSLMYPLVFCSMLYVSNGSIKIRKLPEINDDLPKYCFKNHIITSLIEFGTFSSPEFTKKIHLGDGHFE